MPDGAVVNSHGHRCASVNRGNAHARARYETIKALDPAPPRGTGGRGVGGDGAAAFLVATGPRCAR